MHCLVQLNGPTAGTSVDLTDKHPSIKIGRDASCQILLDDGQVSRVHAELHWDKGQWRIEDHDSTNGTHLNSRPIERAILSPGDLIRVGGFLMVYSVNLSPDSKQMDAACFTDNTRVRRILGAEKRQIAEDPIKGDSTSSPIRKLSFLYRMSKEVFQAEDLDSFLTYAVESLAGAIRATDAKICIRNNLGRLRSYVLGGDQPSHDSANMLAHWVIEKDEALLIDVNDNISWRSPDETVERGTAIGAPIPGRSAPIGAIECFQSDPQRCFELADLEFLLSVCQHIGMAVESIQQHARIRGENNQLRRQLKETQATMIGQCEAIGELRPKIARVARTNVTTLVLGESGTGKEVASQLIHQLSDRANGPFVAVNCAAFSDSLLESELFGHEKGAFTGADAQRKGQFERAHEGTIFLDEVGELSLSCQAKLLRLLEGKPFERLGGTKKIRVDVRIVAATHRNLQSMVQANEFREDLWYRLRVVELTMPPLRERGDDILLLAEHFLSKFLAEFGLAQGERRFAPQTIAAMRSHRWTGNIRELKNAIERALVLCSGEEIRPSDLGIDHHSAANPLPPTEQGRSSPPCLSLAELEKKTHP